MDQKAIREMVREMIDDIIKNHGQIKETDLVANTKKNWEQTKTDLKDTVAELIKNLEADDYKEGLDLIDKAIGDLKNWKIKINKNI